MEALRMSLKALIATSASAFALSLMMPSQAQERDPEPTSNPTSTTQTDQSEDDWRQSRRKADTDDYDPVSDPISTGAGNIMITTEPIDQLPPESRRHLKRQRALVIAGMGPDGQMQDAD